MIALDASVLIAYLEGDDALHERAEQALLDHAREPFCASVLTLAEVLVAPARAGAVATVRRALAGLGVAAVALDGDDDLTLAELRAATGLKLPDCAVLLAAEKAQASVLTFDERLRRASEQRGLAVALG